MHPQKPGGTAAAANQVAERAHNRPDHDSSGGGAQSVPDGPATGHGELSSAAESDAPGIAPPALDDSPQQSAAQIDEHVQRAQGALRGPNKDPNLAIAEAKRALALDPNHVDALALLAHGYYFRKLDDTAQVLLDMAFNSDNEAQRNAARSSDRLYYLQGLLYQRAGDPTRALLAYEKATAINPKNHNALLNLGVQYVEKRRYREALSSLENVANAGVEGNAVLWNALASAYRGLAADAAHGTEQRDALLLKAESAYRAAIQADANYSKGYYNLGLLYLDADPFPTQGGSMDSVKRLETAATYFEQYRSKAGADLALVDERIKGVKNYLKKEQRKKQTKPEDKEEKSKAATKDENDAKEHDQPEKDDDWDDF